MTCTLREDQHTFFDVSLSSEIKMFQMCRENQNIFYVQRHFAKIVPFMRKRGKVL